MSKPNTTNTQYGAVDIESEDTNVLLTNQNHNNKKKHVKMYSSSTRIQTLAYIATVLAAIVVIIVMLLSTSKRHSMHSRSKTTSTSSSSSSALSPEDQELFYHDQLVDHFDDNNKETWSNRYYKSTKYFQGAGHAIIIIVGGEGSLDHGMLYPFVTEHLAKRFGAAVLQIEHRFYGPYRPIVNATTEQLLKLLTPSQAMADMIQLTKHVRNVEWTDCSPHRDSPNYCPIITVGASYPGFLSAMFRIVHGDFVDISYASSAPLLMYAQQSDPNSYYDVVTSANDRASPGCSHAVQTTVEEMMDRVDASLTLQKAAKSIGICPHHLPEYVTSKNTLKQAVYDVVKVSFAGYNSDAYPPGPKTSLYKACQVFLNQELNTKDTLSLFFKQMLLQEEEDDEGCDMSTVHCHYRLKDFDESCFDFAAYEEGGDDGDDNDDDEIAANDGDSWSFQTCTNVIFLAGLSNSSFLPPHEATYQELDERCQEDFGVSPRPTELVNRWDYVNKLNTTSHILFVNGMQDMWSTGSILYNVSDTVVAFNIENGAHHSELSHSGPSDKDTPDVKEAFVFIENLLAKWLNDIQVH